MSFINDKEAELIRKQIDRTEGSGRFHFRRVLEYSKVNSTLTLQDVASSIEFLRKETGMDENTIMVYMRFLADSGGDLNG